MTGLRCLSVVFLAALVVSTGIARAGELRLWSTETAPERLATISYLSDLFGALNAGITVTFTSIPDEQLLDRLASVDDEEAPAMIHTVGEFLALLGANRRIDDAAATQLVDSLGRASFFDGALGMLASSSGPGSVWGVPYHGWVQGLWYRRDLFAKAGLGAPKDWDDIERAAKTLHDPGNGQYGILLGTGQDTYAEQVFQHLALSNGVRMFNGAGDLVFDSPETRETLAFIVRLSRYAPPRATGWRGRDFYLQGRLGMMFYSTFIMDDLALPSVAANSLGTEHYPSLSGAAFDPDLVHNSLFQGQVARLQDAGFGRMAGFGISPGLSGDEKDMVHRFIRFLFEEDNYVTWLHMAPGGMLPVRRGQAAREKFLRDPQGVFGRYGRERMAKLSADMEQVSSLGTVKTEHIQAAARIFQARIIPRMIYRAVHEKVSVESAVSEAAKEMRLLIQ